MVGLWLQLYSQPFENWIIPNLDIFVRISNGFDTMVAISPDFKWLGFRFSDPIPSPNHLQPNLFLTVQKADQSGFQSGLYYILCFISEKTLWGLVVNLHSVARNFLQKVAKFQKTPKHLHQSTFENPKYLQHSSSKSQNAYIKAQKERSKTGLKPVFCQTFKRSQKSSQKGQVAK